MDKNKPRAALVFRRAETEDFESLVSLQNLNLASNLSDEQRRDGFLSVRFSAEQFADMNDDLCVVVAVEEKIVKAFLSASTVQFNAPFALPKTMIDRLPQVIYDSKPLSDWFVCIAGPICIDADLRGQGLLKMLYDCFYNIAPVQYELATLFVAVDNRRSIRAHEKLGMRIIDEFDFDSRRHVIMAGKINRQCMP
jgi:hypothetical protein